MSRLTEPAEVQSKGPRLAVSRAAADHILLSVNIQMWFGRRGGPPQFTTQESNVSGKREREDFWSLTTSRIQRPDRDLSRSKWSRRTLNQHV